MSTDIDSQQPVNPENYFGKGAAGPKQPQDIQDTPPDLATNDGEHTLFDFINPDNVESSAAMPHSGSIPQAEGGELPVREFSDTTLRKAVAENLVGPVPESPGHLPEAKALANKNKPGLLGNLFDSRTKKVSAIGAGVALVAAGAVGLKVAHGYNDAPQREAVATVPATTKAPTAVAEAPAPSPTDLPNITTSVTGETKGTSVGGESTPVIGRPFTVEPKLVKETPLEGEALVHSLRISASQYKTPEEAFGQFENRLRDWMNTGNASTFNIVNEYQGGVIKWLRDLSAKTGTAYTAALLGPNAGDPGLASWAQDRITVHSNNLIWEAKILYPNNYVVTTQVDKPYQVGYVLTLKNITKLGGANNEFTASFDASTIDNGGENIVGRSRAGEGSGPLGDMTPDSPNNLVHNTVSLEQADMGDGIFWVVAP